MGEHNVFFAWGAGELASVFLLWSSPFLYVDLNIGSVMAENALYCLQVVRTQISLHISADCLGSLLFAFVWDGGPRADHTVSLGLHFVYIL